jgi:hypothetical protein
MNSIPAYRSAPVGQQGSPTRVAAFDLVAVTRNAVALLATGTSSLLTRRAA